MITMITKITMRRFSAVVLMGTAGLACLLAPGVGAQQPTDPMQGMHERMQAMQSMMTEMHQMMMSMHGDTAGQAGQPGMHGMGMQGQGMQGQQGMGMGMQAQQGAGTMTAGACSMADGFGALLGACPSNLALTEAQTTALNAIFERARTEALATLTPEQHAQVHSQMGTSPQPH